MEWYETLNRNLEALKAYSPQAVAPIEYAAPASVEWIDTPEGPSARYNGRLLASAKAPRTEAKRLAEAVDIMENAVIVVPGFGLGYHVEAISRRMQCYGAIIVFEPDVGLLQEVLSTIDHSGWLAAYNVMVLTEPGEMIPVLSPILTLVGIGLTQMGYPAGEARLRHELPPYFRELQDSISWCRMTLNTSICLERVSVLNALMNIDRYVTSGGIEDLHNCLLPRTLEKPQDAANSTADG